MSFFNAACFKDWKFYFKLGFGLFFLAVVLYGWLSPLINGPILSDAQKAEAVNWRWFLIDKGDQTLNFFSFFTIQTNIFVALWLIFAAIFWQQEGKVTSKWFGQYLTLAITTYIAVTGIIFNALLLPTLHLTGFFLWFTTVVQHTVVPLVMIIYFLFLMPREANGIVSTKIFIKQYLWLYFLYPLVWIIVMMIRGEFRYQAGKAWAYQYFFMDIHRDWFGLPGGVWLLIAAVLIILIIIIIAILFNYLTFIIYNNKEEGNKDGKRKHKQ